ncbi:long-chain-fatty-acid--CoA ligase [Ancylothrix sp. C2]|uniref:long-chain-fatty-acid--CoA ligase n=1 Tax=Ancylothrix sp. D3o TaxID=2953691 RepID=UPI0021BAB7FD|nr:long-chain-fatty-acid--CoA ligase [Ancylothrix sp. D3o]MCT7952595.1 long-chain-fatty-acid--CoA ligase [Ancylothrix sp. D3o]
MNIAHHIERGRSLFPDKIALVFEDKSYTYKQLDRLTNRVANGLRDLGIHRGDRVALFLPNIPEFVISYLAILKIGGIAVSVNVTLKSAEVSYILNDCAAKAIVTTELQSEEIQKADLPELQHILIAEGKAHKGISLSQLMENASEEARSVEMDSHAPACILYTSGTTGFPKGATLSHGNIVSNIYSADRCYQISQNDRLLLFLPLFHCFGQNAILNSGLNACATIILHRRFDLEEILQIIADRKVTMFFGVPTVFIKMLNTDTSSYDITSVRYYFSAAAPMPIEVAQNWQDKYGFVIYEGYGLTETSPFASYNHDLKYKLGSIGTPIENVEMKIVDSKGHQVSPGELGEIVIKGSNVMLGYWNRPFETQEAIKNGWFYTGDIGRMDEEGFFYIVDRVKDMINVFGLKVYPTEVENVIYQHPAIAEVAVYGVLDAGFEIVTANVILKDGYQITEGQIIEFCSQRMAAYKVPHHVKFVDSIPKNPTGKVLKKILRSELRSSEKLQTLVQENARKEGMSREFLSVLSPEERQIALQSYLHKELAQVLKISLSELTAEQKLNQLGLESLMAVDLKGKLEMSLKVSIPLVTFLKDISIDGLASHITEELTAELMTTHSFYHNKEIDSVGIWEEGIL